METRKVDKIKLMILGENQEVLEKIVQELKKANISSEVTTSRIIWKRKLSENIFNAGAAVIRAENYLETMEATKSLREKKTSVPLFVFASVQDSGLLVEAEESGFNDHFFLPIDIDLIATKLGQYFLQDDLQKMQLSMNRVSPSSSSATLYLKTKITAVDENGIHLSGVNLLSKGAEIEIKNSDILLFLGIESLQVIIEKTSANEDGTFNAYAEWKKNAEEMANAVRKWSLESKMN